MKPHTLVLLVGFLSVAAQGDEDKIQLKTTRIKANKELPQILYIVPWKDFEAPSTAEQKLRLHDFFGDLYNPILAEDSSDLLQPPR